MDNYLLTSRWQGEVYKPDERSAIQEQINTLYNDLSELKDLYQKAKTSYNTSAFTGMPHLPEMDIEKYEDLDAHLHKVIFSLTTLGLIAKHFDKIPFSKVHMQNEDYEALAKNHSFEELIDKAIDTVPFLSDITKSKHAQHYAKHDFNKLVLFVSALSLSLDNWFKAVEHDKGH